MMKWQPFKKIISKYLAPCIYLF